MPIIMISEGITCTQNYTSWVDPDRICRPFCTDFKGKSVDGFKYCKLYGNLRSVAVASVWDFLWAIGYWAKLEKKTKGKCNQASSQK